MDSIEETNTWLNQLKEARDRRDQAKAELDKMLELFQASDEYQNVCAVRAFASSEVETLESEIRTRALVLHELCAELPDRVSVKQFTVVSIPDESKAKEWCLRNFTPCLKLDTKAFEKAAKDGGIPSEFATVSKEARAQIATKL